MTDRIASGASAPRGLPGFPDPHGAARLHRERGGDVLLLDATAPAAGGWGGGPLLAIESRPLLRWRHDSGAPDPLSALSRRVALRVGEGGGRHTGVLALLGYELRGPGPFPGVDDDRLPECVAWEVDRSVRWDAAGDAWLHERRSRPGATGDTEPAWWEAPLPEVPPSRAAARVHGEVRSSLPREAYVAAVERVLGHIGRGDIYQANLCQRFSAAYRGDPLAFYTRHAVESVAPRSAYVESDGLHVASFSPETFVDIREGRIETWPIKGTRPRGANPAADRRAAESLLASAKDRAELLMIVDLERNDLGRVCRTGSVEVPVLARLDSFPAVHHLVARVRGVLKDGVDGAGWLEALFPGGSITGAPKRSAMQILQTLEPVRRNFFTGSLVWFADDGSVESSILIRTAVFDSDRVYLGAGGGVVADSNPLAEWRESNHKARAIARVLGFEPETVC